MKRRLLVLAGGFGTRLRSAVADVPKPLAPVAGLPYLHYLIQQWTGQEVDELIFLLHHQARAIQLFLNSMKDKDELNGCRLHALTEPQPLGTGGAVAFAVQQLQLSGSLLITNADTWLGSGIREVLEAPHAAMAIVKVENSERYGSVLIKEDKVIDFKEKQNSSGMGWINAGLYHLDAVMFRHWDGLPYSLEQKVFPQLAMSAQLNAVPLETDFIDIGIPSDYHRFCRWIESGRSGAL